uniref:Uncharacterized protein n=1 Tax=Ixodes ricinus TaxID=34613 RepID=A0A0K8RF48_IXORI
MTLGTQHLAQADGLLHSSSRLPSLNVKPGMIAPRVPERYSFANDGTQLVCPRSITISSHKLIVISSYPRN